MVLSSPCPIRFEVNAGDEDSAPGSDLSRDSTEAAWLTGAPAPIVGSGCAKEEAEHMINTSANIDIARAKSSMVRWLRFENDDCRKIEVPFLSECGETEETLTMNFCS